MKTRYPKKINKGSHVRVIAPSRSYSIISDDVRNIAHERFKDFGITVSFGKHVEECDIFNSSSIESRLEDLHEAFEDSSVDGILTAIGGYNSNQLLESIDFKLIQKNPKMLCGFSDSTSLHNAIYAQTGLVTFSGPHFSTFGMKKGLDYTSDEFFKAIGSESSYSVEASTVWSDDLWFLDQENRTFLPNEGWWVIREGVAQGTVVGGHARCLASLQGTKYWPGLKNAILCVEEDAELPFESFDRILHSFSQQKDFSKIKALLVGRFQKKSNVTKEIIKKTIQHLPLPKHIPVIANVDFGHTIPIFTLPIGGTARVSADAGGGKIIIMKNT
jgi:muramoyltetrapeptide carboxypeptidase LdcA involved in peptidoglycan recycling